MKYKITIETLNDSTDSKYPTQETIYEQIVDDIDLKKVVLVVNGIVNTN